jgi:ribosomal subunit interface protein
MSITVNFHNIDHSEALREFAIQAITSLSDKFFTDDDWVASVDFSKKPQKNGKNRIETWIKIVKKVSGMVFLKGNSESTDPYTSFNSALNNIEKQVRKHHSRFLNYKKSKSNENSLDLVKMIIEPENEVVDGVKILEEKRSIVEILSVNDAIMQMDLMDLPALVFINSETGSLDFIYYRKDGNVSLICGVGKPKI